MSSTSASAAAAHTGSERSMPSRRTLTGTASRRAAGTLTAPGSRPEELHEALLDLLVPLLELLRVRGEELELGDLRLVVGVLHLGMARVEPFAVRQRLLEVAAERKVGEEAGRGGVRGEAGDGGGGDDEGDAFLRVDDLDGVPLLLGLVVIVLAAVDRDRPLAGGDHAGRIDRRLDEHELVLSELLEVVPAVQVHEGQHVSRDHPAVPRVRRHLLALPLGIEQVLPGPGRLRGRDDLRVVGDHVDSGAQAVVVAVAVLEAGGKALHAGGRVLRQELLVLQQDEVPGVRGVEDVGVLDVGLQFLHDALEDPLGAGPVDLDLDPRVRSLEELRHLLGGGERQRRVPDDLALLARRLDPRVLGGRGDGGEHEAERDEAREARELCHGVLWAARFTYVFRVLRSPSPCPSPAPGARVSKQLPLPSGIDCAGEAGARTSSISPKVSSGTVYAVSDSMRSVSCPCAASWLTSRITREACSSEM